MSWRNVLKTLPKTVGKRIDNIMDDGEERTSAQIKDALYDLLDKDNTQQKNYKKGADIPRAFRIGQFLGRNPNYTKRVHQNQTKYAKVK